MFDIRFKKLGQVPLRLDTHPLDLVMTVEIRDEEFLELAVFPQYLRAETDHLAVHPAEVPNAFDPEVLDIVPRCGTEVLDEKADQGTDRLQFPPLWIESGMFADNFVVDLAPEFDFLKLLEGYETRFQTIVDIVVVVGYLVCEIYELSLDGRDSAGHEVGHELGRMIIGGLVLDDPLARLPRQVQPVEARITLFELVDHPQGLVVVLEPAEPFHETVEDFLASMTERRVAQIMGKGKGLGQLLIQPKNTGYRLADLRDFQGMGKPGPVIIALVVHENLSFVLKAAKCRAVDDPVAIPFKGRSIIPELFHKTTAGRITAFGSIRGEIRAFSVNRHLHRTPPSMSFD